MSGLKALKLRINSVKSTRKITKAMQMVAAAKLRRAQDAAAAATPYAEKLDETLAGLVSSASRELSEIKLLAGNGSEKRHLLIVITADRGLCGAFNTAVIKKAKETTDALIKSGRDVKIFCIGRRGLEAMRFTYPSRVKGGKTLSEVKRVDFEYAAALAGEICDAYERDEYDICDIVYSKFNSVLLQSPEKRHFLPLSLGGNEGDAASDSLYDPGVSSALLARELATRAAAARLFSCLLESGAGEQASRMTAMDNATRNAGDMINKLTLQYNRTRQANITKELIEIISGAEAL